MDGFWPTCKRRRQAPGAGTVPVPRLPEAPRLQPGRVVLPLQDRPHDPYDLCVRVGDRVAAGQIIGRAGTPPRHMAVHAGIAGVVKEITLAMHPLHEKVMSVVIAADGDAPRILYSTRPAGSADMQVFLRDMGIPLDAYSVSPGLELLVNATEFEPGFSSVEQLFEDCPDRIREGLALLMDICGVRKARVVAEACKSALCRKIREVCAGVAGSRLDRISRPWPTTLRSMVTRQTTASRVSCGLVADPATLIALADACLRGIAWTDQLITLCGSGIARPGNLWVPCGTPLSDIISRAGGRRADIGRILLGGPMMGIAQHSAEVPLIRRVRGVYAAAALVFDESHRSRLYQRSDCIRCGKCVDVCPAGIPPNMIVELIEHRCDEDARAHGLFSCLECGLCHYVCPSRIPLSSIMALGKLRVQGADGLLTFQQYRLPIESSAGGSL